MPRQDAYDNRDRSRQHAEAERDADGVMVREPGSKNGIVLGGRARGGGRRGAAEAPGAPPHRGDADWIVLALSVVVWW
ncbi:MAG: hypothetical protein JWM10_2757 [Myxococcaceae bacterium]|nr:hypothetical protein [Myxococcaceae bacterium]